MLVATAKFIVDTVSTHTLKVMIMAMISKAKVISLDTFHSLLQ